jgi:hypothetical protein
MKTQLLKGTLIILLLIPVIAFSQTEIKVSSKGNQTHTYKSNNGVSSTELEYRGKIIFTDDETDVKYISPGGFLRFSKRSFGNRRTIILEGQSNNKITREYREGSKTFPFEPEGRKWMASVLPEIIRSTGIGAEERVKKFYDKGGVDAVINEISLLPTNYVQGIYYTAALALNGLSSKDIIKLVEDAGDEISSSYELSKLLISSSEALNKDDATLAATIKVVREISSSYEQAKVYKHLLTKSKLSENNKALIINGVRDISSSYEKSGVLIALLEDELNSASINLVIAEVEHINSSYEQSKVLQYLLKNQSTEELDLELMLKAISQINSSYEQGKVLKQLVEDKDLSSEQIVVVASAAENISSSYEKSKFLQNLINKQNLDEEGINAILEMTDELNSSYEKSKVLQLIITSDNFNNSNFTAIIKAATSIGSSYELSNVLGKVIDHDKMSDKHMIELIDAIDGISSNYEKSKLLQNLAKQLPETKEVRDAFYQAAESLSDFDYGKVMRAARGSH